MGKIVPDFERLMAWRQIKAANRDISRAVFDQKQDSENIYMLGVEICTLF
jgi:hypothetical protein